MKDVRVIEVKKSVFESNDERAKLLRDDLKKEGVFLLNLMSSPGSGKTTTLTRTIEMLKDDIRIGVMEADIDTGAVRNVMILSVPEGDDKPLKYPLMFSVCDVVLINKIDVLSYFDFDIDKCKEYIAKRNPDAKVIPICAKTGEGMTEWTGWLKSQVTEWKNA